MKTLRKSLLTAFLIPFFTFPLFSQDADTVKYWDVSGFGSTNFNQVSFTNWAAGGDNTISLSLVGLVQAKYDKNRHHMVHTGNFLYGFIRNNELGLRKNDDKIELESKYGYDLTDSKKLLLSFLANYRSQFAKGFNFPNDSIEVSRFAAPGYITLALGLDYKPAPYFSLFFSPATGKITLVRDQNIANTGMYGNEGGVPLLDLAGNEVLGADGRTVYTTLGKRARFEFGAFVSAQFNKEVVKNVTLMTRLDLFNNYTDKNKDNRKYIDVNWETNILFKINEWLSASLIMHLIYDKEIMIDKEVEVNGMKEIETKDRVQFKEVLGIGLTYKFDNQKKKKTPVVD